MIWYQRHPVGRELDDVTGRYFNDRFSLEEPFSTITADGVRGAGTCWGWFLIRDGHEDNYIPANGKPAYRVPSIMEIDKTPWNGLNIVSTFSGCGGSCLGFKMAGYRVLWANEFVPAARDTYRLNHATPVDPSDVRQVTARTIREVIGDIELDVLEGSPPCASFSVSGHLASGWGKVRKYSDVEQRTDDLFGQYVRLVDELRPRAFVAENVFGLVRGVAKGYFKRYLAMMRALPYNVEAMVLDAQWLGVPQRRKRLIFIGVRKDVGSPRWCAPLEYQYSAREALPMIHEGEWKTVPQDPTLERRLLTIAEVRRLCSFPDDFRLTGTFPQQWERLGRAVPPLMMAAIARALVPVLRVNSMTHTGEVISMPDATKPPAGDTETAPAATIETVPALSDVLPDVPHGEAVIASDPAREFYDSLIAAGHQLFTNADESKLLVSDASRLTLAQRAAIGTHRPELIAFATGVTQSAIDDLFSRVDRSERTTDQPCTVLASSRDEAPRDETGRDVCVQELSIGVDCTVTTSSGEETFTPIANIETSLPTISFVSRPMDTSPLINFLKTQRTSNALDLWIPDEPPSLDDISDVVVNFATDGLAWTKGNTPIGVTVSTLDGQLTRFLPFRFEYGGNLDEETIKRWARFELRGKKIWNANTRFDIHMAREWGVDLVDMDCTFSDVQHTAALLDDNRKVFKLDELAKDYLPDLPTVERVDESRHHHYHAAEVADRERFTAQLVGKLHAVFAPMVIEQDLTRVQALEDRVIPAVVEMEKNGAPIDVELMRKYSAECLATHDRLVRDISTEAGFAFDHSRKSWDRLFEACKLAPKDSYAEAIIKAVNHPLVQKAYRASQYASLNSKTFKAYEDRLAGGTILRYDINQLRNDEGGTVTGRFSAGLIQQVPNAGNHKAVFGDDLFPRRIFVAGNGQYLAADAEQIQYRIFAHYANNPKIMAMYAKDPHTSFHRMIEGLLRPHKPDLIYGHVKNLNFMRIFGGGLVKLALMMEFITPEDAEDIERKKSQRTDPRLDQAREIEKIYERELPEVAPLLRKASHLAASSCTDRCKPGDALHRGIKHRGFVKTILGRRSRFPNNYRLHKAFCMIDQGSEGDIVKTKIAELFETRKETGFVLRMTVHDEVTGDALEPDTASKVKAILNEQSFPEVSVPILWECGTGATWADCK